MAKEKYKNLIRAIELVNIELQELNCYKNNNLASDKRSNLEVGIKNDIVEQFYEELEFKVHILFDVFVYHADNLEEQADKIDDNDVLFNIKFTLESTYNFDLSEIEDSLNSYEDELDKFAKRNVPINTWPYAREIISSITTRMGFPPLIIPTNKNVSPF